MTGDRCHRRRKMMGRGADGGCGTEERPCPVSRVPAKNPATQPEIEEKQRTSPDIDLYSQARKALSERSPFDAVPEENSALSLLTLPSGLASFLWRSSDSRRRHKKSHSGADKKSARPARGSNIWVETEEYFRDLTLPDIESLYEVSSPLSSLVTRKCFLIPFLENDPRARVEEEVKSEAEQAMEIDTVGADVSAQDEKSCSVSASSGGLEWLLGTRNKISLTSERPSKKRRLLGSDAGLEKVLIACPCEGNSSLCHFCCMGDTGKESNQLIVCSLCKVAVHQKCYGVQEDVDESWLCAWCKQMSDSSDSVKPCVLCPKQGGALKPIHKTNENDGALEFAHLFCCHWMPEVYIEDLKKMEPIMNVGGIKETRRKLVCNVCKVKCGACVRCSHGTCRTSFHPLCAREARLRMEVWGKYRCDDVELRAFCPKHSDVQSSSSTSRVDDPTLAVGGDSNVANHLPVAVSLNKLHKSKIDCQNGENIAVHIGTPDATNKSGDSGLQERGFSSSGLNTGIMSDCGDAQQLINVGTLQRSTEDVNLSDSLNVALILKKLIDRGKASVKDVALDIGISPDSLTATLADDGMVPELRCKILKWLRNHTYISTLEKNLKVKANSEILCKGQGGTTDGSDALAVSDSNNPDSVAVKSVPPRRRTKSNVRILKDSKVICSPAEFFSDNGIMMAKNKVDQFGSEETEKSSNSDRPSNYSFPGRVHLEDVAICEQKASVNGDQGNPVCSTVNSVVSGVMNTEAVSSFYIHPCICKKLLQMEWVMLSKHPVYEFNGPRGREISRLEASSTASFCCNHQNQLPKCNNKICNSDGLNLEQLAKAREMGVLDLSPEDEVEGEIVYFQHRLLSNAAARKQFTDNLICNVAQSLPREIDASRWQRWDSVLVNQYLCELREAKKQGRKERKHKEAQAVLAAATAAAAASSRISSFRKDSFDDSAQQESLTNLNTSNGRSSISSQLMPRVTETLPRVAPRVSSERQSDFVHLVSDLSKENPRSCDICRRSETILNPILVCLSCKVAVHLDCYRSVKESTGPWCCELCEDLSSRSSGATPHNFWEKPYFVAECGLCGGTAGAFRKSSNGEWVHAFCAEWVFESTFRRGQVNPIEGMETVLKEAHACYICRRKHGVCIKCNFGHCQITFHPTCARSSGFYMNIKNYGGKLQHKAYCEKHSLEQRAKAETHEHGIEEFKKFKQIRVELERLRLICERIIRREKKKRELVLCSHDILSFKRDQIARTLLAHNPFFLPDVSSESATTSLKGHTDDYKSCSDAIQRSDDITVDSTASVKRRIKVPVSMDTDQKIDDDCSTSHVFFTQKLTERSQCSGKQIPQKPSSVASHNLSDEGGWRSKYRKHAETFEKEIIMTSDQASMKNMRLPKGYQYVPADILHSGEQINQDASSSGEPSERHE
nr:protein jade-1 [Quercus suber]